MGFTMFTPTARSLSFLHLFALLVSLTGVAFFDFTITAWLTVAVAYFMYTAIGFCLMLHRYWTHKNFEFKSPIVKWIFTFIALVSGNGSVLWWTYVHRLHHLQSDTRKDPHSPHVFGWRMMFPFLLHSREQQFDRSLVRDHFNKTQLLLNKYYFAIVASFVVILILIDPWIAYFGWFVPVTISRFIISGFNYFGHTIGYRNHVHENDQSTNNWVFALLLWGEGWHNNHHHAPFKYNLQERWWEIDVIHLLIRGVRK